MILTTPLLTGNRVNIRYLRPNASAPFFRLEEVCIIRKGKAVDIHTLFASTFAFPGLKGLLGAGHNAVLSVEWIPGVPVPEVASPFVSIEVRVRVRRVFHLLVGFILEPAAWGTTSTTATCESR